MRNNTSRKIYIKWVAVAIVLFFLATMFWPRRFCDFLRPGEAVTFYITTRTYTEDSSLPEMGEQHWTVQPDTPAYEEIMGILEQYRCRLSLFPLKKNNQAPWWNLYQDSGVELTNLGTGDWKANGLHFTLYGGDEAAAQMETRILGILTSLKQ